MWPKMNKKDSPNGANDDGKKAPTTEMCKNLSCRNQSCQCGTTCRCGRRVLRVAIQSPFTSEFMH
ncbi:hypothetical protein B566_EDAN007567 [Ephemera danica]|nr:hypothetical protein B566_EDAN007567 [Ephemera danica]